MWFKGCDDSSLSREAIVFFRDLALLQAVLEMHRTGKAKQLQKGERCSCEWGVQDKL